MVIGIMARIHEDRFFNLQAQSSPMQTETVGPDMSEKTDKEGNTEEYEGTCTGNEVSFSSFSWRVLVLNCRLVCSAWNTAVHSLYADKTMTGIPEFDDDVDARSPFNAMRLAWSQYKFSNIHDDQHPKMCLDYFGASYRQKTTWSTKNPFLGRNIFIETAEKYGREEQYEVFLNAVVSLLECFGSEIWYCVLSLNLRSMTPLQVAQYLQQILCFLPNLKYLKVANITNHSVQFTNNPLPHLRNLEVLCFDTVDSSISSELIRSNYHVNFLNIYNSTIKANVDLVRNLRGYSTWHSITGEQLLTRFGHKWKLQKLKIENSRSMFGLQLFKLLVTNWNETLTNVCLDHPFGMDASTIFVQSKSLCLDLPHVRRLSVLSRHAFFINFALPMKSLEYLKIYWESLWDENSDRISKEQNIELVGFLENMQLSNIWNFFPNLKATNTEISGITIRTFVCQRNGKNLTHDVNY